VVTVSTSTYGSVLVVGGGAGNQLSGYPVYEFSGDADGRFACGRTTQLGFDPGSDHDILLTCSGPESDIIGNGYTDDWPALTTTGAPVAGPGVDRKLLGSVYRRGIGRQVTYGGHLLYLFDNASRPFKPQGERYVETVKPLPPWHGFWFLVSSKAGQPAPGPATVETETLPDGKKAVAVEMESNVRAMAVTVYSYSKDRPGASACKGVCAVKWVPVLTGGSPHVAVGIDAKEVGVIRRPDGTEQVTYGGKPLYLYSAEKCVFPVVGGPPQTAGTVGNGNGLAGPGGGRFSIVSPSQPGDE
jgi:predicted lipoprotein with Yx(FWY)xxD motif